MTRRMVMGAVLAVTLLSGTALVACGGDDDDDGGNGDGATVAVPTAAATSGSEETPALSSPIAEGTDVSSEQTSIVATAADFSFTLDVDAVAAGSIVDVTFNNTGSAPHTITFYADEAYETPLAGGDSGQTASGETSAFQLTEPAPDSGSLYYRCEVHPAQMQGELSVE